MTSYHGTTIRVVHGPYAGVNFPEAAHYSDYIAKRLAAEYPDATIDVEESGNRTRVFVNDDPKSTLAEEIRDWVAYGLWEEFCAHGYRHYTVL